MLQEMLLNRDRTILRHHGVQNRRNGTQHTELKQATSFLGAVRA
jgi:hypothetical protein